MGAGTQAAQAKLSVLLVHGAGGGAWEWNLWRAVLAAYGLCVHVIELQPVPAGLSSTSFQDYALQLRRQLQRMPAPRVLIGASLGGLLAVACADAGDALVLVNPLPPAAWGRATPRRRQWDDVIAWRGQARVASTRAAMADADEASALFAFRHWRDESGKVMREAQDGIEVDKPACPALFVISAQDQDVPPQISLAWAQAWQAKKLQTTATTHVGPLLGSLAPRIAAETVAWLNRLGLRG